MNSIHLHKFASHLLRPKSLLYSQNLRNLSGGATSSAFVEKVLNKYKDFSGEKFNVYNPATGDVVGSVPSMGVKEVEELSIQSFNAWKSWKLTTAKDRARILNTMADLMDKYSVDLATILTLEAGKPFPEAQGEIAYARDFYRYYAEEATRVNGEILQPNVKGRRLLALRQPVGPAILVTPWNFPSGMVTRKVGPALAAGCTVVIKPSEETPFSAIALCEIADEAGLPKGVMSCITVDRKDITEVGLSFCHSEYFRKLSFTGSTVVGKWLMRECASTVKRISLELGGSAPFIVFDDADLDVAANALLASKFRNNGQVCIASNRILVQEGVYEKFAEIVTKKVSALKCGNGFTSGVNLGPLINSKGLEKVNRHVEDCRVKGGVITVGGTPHHDFNAAGGNFYLPTVITGVTKDMLPFQEETFGPIAPLMMFKTEEEAIEIANSTKFGLASYACTKDLARAWRVSEALEFGMVGINEGAISNPASPFGGIKESGLGTEGGTYGINEYLEIKYVCMGLGKE